MWVIPWPEAEDMRKERRAGGPSLDAGLQNMKPLAGVGIVGTGPLKEGSFLGEEHLVD